MHIYATGFCIANFYTKAARRMNIYNYSTHFMCGLKKKTPRACISLLDVYFCPVDGSALEAILPYHVGFLRFNDCSFTNDDLIDLSKIIPHMTSLKTFQLYFRNDVNYKDLDHGLFHILQQLSYSNVTSLTISYPDFCRSLRDSPCDLSSALKKLVCPSCGILEDLEVYNYSVGDDDDDDDSGLLASLVSAPSSLKSLTLGSTSLSGHVSYLKNNTCLTKLACSPI